jgi:hypothetical protein
MTDEHIRISASDVADYVYCRRCWYGRLRGLLPARDVTEAMLRGSSQHTHLSSDLTRHAMLRTILLVVIALAALICVGLIVLGVMVH